MTLFIIRIRIHMLQLAPSNHLSISDLQTVSGALFYNGPALAGPSHLQHEGVPRHQGEHQKV